MHSKLTTRYYMLIKKWVRKHRIPNPMFCTFEENILQKGQAYSMSSKFVIIRKFIRFVLAFLFQILKIGKQWTIL